MFNRTFAASCVALLVAAASFAPGEASAKGPGGFKGGAFKGGAFKGGHHFHRFRRHQGFYGYPLVYGEGASGYYGADRPVVTINNQVAPARDGNEQPTRRVCRSETHTVPSEAGGTRDVTVWRCFRE